MGEPPARRREKFLPEEDAQLKQLVSIYGTSSWDVVAAGIPGRNSRQCRERWKHYLSSGTQAQPWTAEEDRELYIRMEQFGPRWTILSSFFPGRTDIQIKNRWMQRFAHASSLHIQKRQIKIPQFTPTTQPWRTPFVYQPQGERERGFQMESIEGIEARAEPQAKKK
jgi:hypothetical protein